MSRYDVCSSSSSSERHADFAESCFLVLTPLPLSLILIRIRIPFTKLTPALAQTLLPLGIPMVRPCRTASRLPGQTFCAGLSHTGRRSPRVLEKSFLQMYVSSRLSGNRKHTDPVLLLMMTLVVFALTGATTMGTSTPQEFIDLSTITRPAVPTPTPNRARSRARSESKNAGNFPKSRSLIFKASGTTGFDAVGP